MSTKVAFEMLRGTLERRPEIFRKVVKNVGEIVIRDETMGQSWTYQPSVAGYAQADAKIQEITGQGHKAGGDIARVATFMGH